MSENTDEIKRADFRDVCVAHASNHLGMVFSRANSRSQTIYINKEGNTILVFSQSREYNPDTTPGYWFTPSHAKKSLTQQAPTVHWLFACGDVNRLLLVPNEIFESWSPHIRHNEKQYFVLIDRDKDTYTLRPQGSRRDKDGIVITRFLLPPSV